MTTEQWEKLKTYCEKRYARNVPEYNHKSASQYHVDYGLGIWLHITDEVCVFLRFNELGTLKQKEYHNYINNCWNLISYEEFHKIRNEILLRKEIDKLICQ